MRGTGRGAAPILSTVVVTGCWNISLGFAAVLMAALLKMKNDYLKAVFLYFASAAKATSAYES
jgi:hypothetical protein